MGKQPAPSAEELEFIFQCFLRGLSDGEVLEEMQGEEFLLRNPRFLRDRRRHFEAAKKVLIEQARREVDPVIAQSRKEHFEHLADIARTLIFELERVEENASRGDLSETFRYIYWKGETGFPMTEEELTDMFERNIYAVELQHSGYDLGCFTSHLRAEHPDFESKDLRSIIAENPLGLMSTLRVLTRRRTFKGTCPVCQDL